ncbi:MAG: hypothetical protein Q9166_001077 [cf. Caloplaca sp. 2 TL-2023]
MSANLPTRPRVFLDVQCGHDFFGRITIELFSDKTPKTAENFRAICTPPSSAQSLTYKGSRFHRIIDEFMIQGGDITAGNGTGGMSIYGPTFEDENIGWREIDVSGLVCMANRGKDTNSSQFFITLAPCEHLNAKHTVFGHIVKGMDVCERIAKVPVDKNDRSLSEIVVSHCGELERKSTSNATPHIPAKESNGNRRHAQGKAGKVAKRFLVLGLHPNVTDTVKDLHPLVEEAEPGLTRTAVAAPPPDQCLHMIIPHDHRHESVVILDAARLRRAPAPQDGRGHPI